MRLYNTGQISNSEKSDILSKHREVYNGYKTMQPKVSNEQPLYVQDFANDKEGITVNGSGEVSSYSNKIYMKESEVEMDELDIHHLEKGKRYKYKSPSFEDEIEYDDEISYPQGGGKHYSFKGDKAGHLMGSSHIENFVSHKDDTDEGIYDIEDLQKGEEFDYVKGGGNLEEDDTELYEPMTSAFDDELDEVTGPSPLYSEVDFPAYDFKSKGPNFAPHGVKEQFFEDEFSDEDYDFGFESSFCPNCQGSGCEECDGSGMKRNSIVGDRDTAFSRMRRGKGDIEDIDFEDITDDRETAISRMRRGKGDIEDIEWEDITEGLDEEVKESILGLLKPRKKESDRRPYTADAVQNIIKFIKNVKTEEQLDSVMKMVDNLYNSNEDVNDAYKERITHAYKRKADELGNYLKKKDYDFKEVDEDLQESFVNQKNKINEMFNRMNKYN